MSTDNVAQRLHDNATRGSSLSVEEESLVNQWYLQQDMEEGSSLARMLPPQALAGLRVAAEVAVAQLLQVAQRLSALAADNEALRREVAALQTQLTQRASTQSA